MNEVKWKKQIKYPFSVAEREVIKRRRASDSRTYQVLIIEGIQSRIYSSSSSSPPPPPLFLRRSMALRLTRPGLPPPNGEFNEKSISF